MPTFDLDTLIDACRVAIAETTPTAAVRDALQEALHHDVASALPATRLSWWSCTPPRVSRS